MTVPEGPRNAYNATKQLALFTFTDNIQYLYSNTSLDFYISNNLNLRGQIENFKVVKND